MGLSPFKIKTRLAITLGALFLGGALHAVEIDEVANGFVLTGQIESGDDVLLDKALATTPDKREIYLNSAGGEAIAAMRLGHVIRGSGSNTSLSGDCLSACVLAFIGGNSRSLGNGQLGFHQVVDTETGEPISPYHPVYFNLTQYVFWSGVAPTTVIQWMSFASPDEIFYPSPSALCDAHIVTDCAPTH